MFDMARLVINKYQKEVVVPFHFIPIKNINSFSKSEPRSQYRTAQATISGTFLIKDLLDNARKKYIAKKAPKGIKAEQYNLMPIGLLIHIFADTYAHQNFSGFRGWENYSYLEQVTDNFNKGKDITKEYKVKYYNLPSIGHTNVDKAPDNTFVSRKMKMSENKKQKYKEDYTINYSRSNVQVFCDAAKEILWYFRLCQNLEMIDENKWETIKEKLLEVFNTHETEEKNLTKHWRSITGYNYHYSKNELWNDLLIKSDVPLTSKEKKHIIKNEYMPKNSKMNNFEYERLEAFEKKYKSAKYDFFYYNLIAKETRAAVMDKINKLSK